MTSPTRPTRGAVLVVDDDVVIVRAVTMALQTAGFGPVTSATTVPEAEAQLIDGHGFDLVLTDRSLGDDDGLDLVARLRGGGDRTPVVVLSADATESARQLSEEVGADTYLLKPFDLDELYATVENALADRPSQ